MHPRGRPPPFVARGVRPPPHLVAHLAAGRPPLYVPAPAYPPHAVLPAPAAHLALRPRGVLPDAAAPPGRPPFIQHAAVGGLKSTRPGGQQPAARPRPPAPQRHPQPQPVPQTHPPRPAVDVGLQPEDVQGDKSSAHDTTLPSLRTEIATLNTAEQSAAFGGRVHAIIAQRRAEDAAFAQLLADAHDRELRLRAEEQQQREAEIRAESRQQGREEGREEGREAGLLQGREEGRAAGLLQGREEGRAAGLQQGQAQGFQTGLAQGLQQGIAQGWDQATRCVICFAAPRDTVTRPCGHVCMCQGCAPHQAVCPICQGPNNPNAPLPPWGGVFIS
ncbi:unnamed protein product [Vitrella brassicaformis CCMP3155]|uniref:RING-type domain-containing protein n=1 Tax=Vitrella brassicaformis (strain CCMP3155) TaxID=1169540 RepID=A0A0G4H6M6_VITBC|nr:unnamed protein product [Vitrella brassicaformis CCMP3155]|eukprot:CEM39395.1 unnamed protein product [Vitrella brassicaformis CCMP3155]